MVLENALQNALGTDYSIEGELGGGGMSRVFIARDNALHRRVVIKVLTPDLAAMVSTERFEREVLIAAGLQHPNIVPILSAGHADDMPFFVMPFVEGESLRNRLKLTGKLAVKDAVNILRDVGRALAFAHDRGIVHRDIKPDNILLSAGVAMLADFGVAKAVSSAQQLTPTEGNHGLTRIGTSLGTPSYMAPEQAAADEATDHRADIYALGITAFEMLAGNPPFSAPSATALMAAHLTETPVRIQTVRTDVPDWLDELVAQCLAKDPSDRPATADDLVERLEDEPATGAHTTVQRHKKRMRWLVGAVMAVATVAVVALTQFTSTGGARDDVVATVGVLPFVNIGGNTEDEYFTDGLTDELIGVLGRIPELRVASRTGSYAFKGADANIEEIGAALNVSVLLEGTVRRGGDRLRLTAQLVSVDDGLTLWSETYERQITDVFAVQDELTESIVTALRERIGLPQQEIAASRTTTDVDAYDLYLRGRYFFGRRGEEAIQQALGYFEQAVIRDENFAEAYTGIADAYGLLPLYGSTPGDSVLPLAIAAANRAIELDSTLATAFASRASLYNSSWRWADAEQDFRRALALDGRYATAHQWFGEHLLVRGLIDEAVSEFAQAAELDPLAPIINASYAGALGVAHREAEAIERGRRAIELDTAGAAPRFLLGAALIYLGQPDSAIPQLERAVMLAPNVVGLQGLLGLAYAQTGATNRATTILESLDRTNLRTGSGIAIARVFIGLNQLDSALTYMERAATARDPFFASESLASSIFDPLRAHPRFIEIVTQVGLDPALLVF